MFDCLNSSSPFAHISGVITPGITLDATNCKESTQLPIYILFRSIPLPHTSKDIMQVLPLGWKTVNKKRLSLVLKIGPRIGLNMAANTEKLPFLIAAEMQNGKEQFLCPGEHFI